MPRDGQGKFSLPLNNWNPAVQGNDADPEGWMQLISDIATALTQSVADDGQTVMVGPLNMGNNKIRNVGEPTNSKDAIRRQTLAKGSNISSAETISIPSEGMVFEVTGTNNISDIIGGSYDGRVAILVFRDELEIQQSESIYLPGGVNITTKAGDVCIFIRKEMDKWHGLQAVSDQLLGVGQTWQDVTSNRNAGTTYTNTTGRPIQVMVSARLTSAGSGFQMTVTVGGQSFRTMGGGRAAEGSFKGVSNTFTIPAGDTYQVTVDNSATLQNWWELR